MTKKEIQLLDSGYVRLVEAWGSDERVIESARMSTAKGFLGWGPDDACLQCNGAGRCVVDTEVWDEAPSQVKVGPSTMRLVGGRKHVEPIEVTCPQCDGQGAKPGDERLLKFLWDHQHATPFEMAGLVIEVKAPIVVFREWHRHRTQCLTGDSMIACVSPTGSTYQRSIKSIFDLKHGGVVDAEPKRTGNGTSKSGTPVTRDARRKDAWRTRVLPNCQSRTLRVLDESTGLFTTASMASVWESGTKPVFLLETAEGHALRASAEHPFFTQRGWVKMKDIEAGDRVARMGKVAAQERPIPPALRQGIGVWTSMMRARLIPDEAPCYLCGTVFPHRDLALDHVIPVAVSLLTALDERNLRPVCATCHRAKTNSEQPSRVQMSRRGIRWERVSAKPKCVGEEPTYDIEVAGPHHNYVANGLVVHNSYNEMSGRYVALPDENYTPSVARVLHANVATTNKQAQGSGRVVSEEDALSWLADLAGVYEHAQRVYQRGLDLGVPKELARLPVPVARYSAMRASANLRNWLGFLRLRCDRAAQWEIRQYADVVAGLVREHFPRTYEVAQASLGLPAMEVPHGG